MWYSFCCRSKTSLFHLTVTGGCCQGVWMRCWLIPKNWPEARCFSVFFCNEKKGPVTPWKINGWFTYKSPEFRKEHDRNQTSMIMFHVHLQGCSCFSFFVGLLFLHLPPLILGQWKMGCLQYEFPFIYGDFPLNNDYGGKGILPSYVPFWLGWLKMWIVYIQFLFGKEMPEKQTMFTGFVLRFIHVPFCGEVK